MLIKDVDLFAFLHSCIKDELGGITEILLPSQSKMGKENGTYFSSITRQEEFNLDSYRTNDPAKMLFYLARERMITEEFKQEKRIIMGVKACDLKALRLLDKAMVNKDFVDPSYSHWRENTFIVSTDCTEAKETCHCTLLNGKPYAEADFDLNLSRIDGSYLVSVGSDKGNELFSLLKENLPHRMDFSKEQEIISLNRQQMVDVVTKQNIKFIRDKNYQNLRATAVEKWDSESKDCVGCGACTNICPTCYCLILNDESEAHKFIKVRSFDSCQWNGYARVAGGDTPRPKMFQRFRNRYLCKFNFMKMNFDEFGCTGCGRCTDACPANIDFRQVVKETNQAVTDN